jgi:hypothetical protein
MTSCWLDSRYSERWRAWSECRLNPLPQHRGLNALENHRVGDSVR